MWILITAVVTASLLGSMHCVGMCGPLAIWASGAGERASGGRIALSTSLYHLGRLVTYTIAGLIAGGIGSLVDIGGETLGFQLAAARVVGALMVAIGFWRLGAMLFSNRMTRSSGPAPSRIGGLLVKLRPLIFQLPASGRAISVGMLTTLLPCGWLYLFALVAAGTGNVWMGGITMAAFWVGTVPALTALIAGTQALSHEFVRIVPTVTAILLIVTGGITASGRGFAQLGSLSEIRSEVSLDLDTTAVSDSPSSISDRIESLTHTPLPCCVDKAETESSETNSREASSSSVADQP